MKYAFILLLILTSCSPIKRLNRLQKNHPYLFTNIVDTVKVPVNILVPKIEHDTVFKHTYSKDTVTLIKDRLTIRYFNNGDTVYLSGKCDTLTIRDTVTVIQNKYVVPEQKNKPFPIVTIILFVIGIGLIIYRIFGKS
jgi:hypothetical protein